MSPKRLRSDTVVATGALLFAKGFTNLWSTRCGRGGTGRRATLRSLWANARGSSSLLDRTKQSSKCYNYVFFEIICRFPPAFPGLCATWQQGLQSIRVSRLAISVNIGPPVSVRKKLTAIGGARSAFLQKPTVRECPQLGSKADFGVEQLVDRNRN